MCKLAVFLALVLSLAQPGLGWAETRLVVSPPCWPWDSRIPGPGRSGPDIYRNAGARTNREKAEALWRFLLTDGRFVEPGQFYHIAGWAYEEPLARCSIRSSC